MIAVSAFHIIINIHTEASLQFVSDGDNLSYQTYQERTML